MRQRAESGHGVYGVKVFDFARLEGQQEMSDWEAGIDADIPFRSAVLSNQTVAVFVLDVRTSKTPWKQGAGRFQPDAEGDYLGERQWEWFENSIRRSHAAVNVVVNGLQVFANRFPDGNTAESWNHYPRSQQRLIDAMLQDGVESPILVSGDVHMTQLMRKDCARKGEHQPRRTLVEMTTSGLTHSWGTISTPLSDPDRKPSLFQRYQSFAGKTLIHSLHNLCPWTDIMKATSSDSTADGLYVTGGGEGSSTGLQYSLLQNFGELEFDWDDRTVSLRSMGKNEKEPPLLMAKFSMDQLSGRSTVASPHLTPSDFQSETNSAHHRLHQSDWVCINHRGRDSTLSHMLGHASTVVVLVTVVPLPLLLPVFLFLFLVRRWAQRSTIFPSNGPRRRGTKRRMLKRMVKSKIPKDIRLRYRTYASLAKRDLQTRAKVKVTKGSREIPVSMVFRDIHQFS